MDAHVAAVAVVGTGPGPVRWPVLLGGFRTDPLALSLDALLAGALLVYGAGLVRLRRRGHRWPQARVAAFAAGSLALFVALGSGLAAYDDVNPPLHVVQHVLVMMVAAPLFVLGQPLVLLAQAGSRRTQRAVVRLTNSRALVALTGVPGALLYYASMPAYFLTGMYALSVHSNTVHELCHACFFTLGLLFWTGTLGPDSPGRRLGAPRRMAAVVAGMPAEAALGLALVLWPRPLSAGETLTQVHTAGQVFWIMSMALSGSSLVVLFHRWMVQDERAARRLDYALAVRPVGEVPQDGLG